MNSSSSSDQDTVDRLAEEFVARHRRGEHPDLAEYTDQFPQYADAIRDLFPALVLIEQVKPRGGDQTGTYAGAAEAGAAGRRLERLGDIRILREVGRGGMGVVYEADQESLGRHVAVKILPNHTLLDPRQLDRFQREARAAARLHHTNIVPVFGVGEQDGLHYYVMQFIQGQSLDTVLDELRRLRRSTPDVARGHQAVEDDRPGSSTSAHEVSVAAVARSLLTGQFALHEPAPGAVGSTPTSDGEAPLASAVPSDRIQPSTATAPVLDPKQVGVAVPASGVSNSSATVSFTGDADLSSLSGSQRGYWQGVARVGLQVAGALAYAHGQRILHRDIKPSNLLLDARGNVWVADFGLAKASEGEDLTGTGDVVGTLRYLAPERLRGQSDPRGDVYSLGLTLYELLTLRPAFDAADRERLIQQVTQGEPPRPRQLEPSVPRDLETIVLKAIAREPGHRYATAGALAEDLQRFVDDRPIAARRVSGAERAWRWCRRNPGIAGLSASTLALLVIVAVGSSVLAIREHQAQNNLEENLYFSRISLAAREMEARNVGRAVELLEECPRRLRGWEWHYLQRIPVDRPMVLPGHAGRIAGIAYSPVGDQIASIGLDLVKLGDNGEVKVWDTKSGREMWTARINASAVRPGHRVALAFSRDGRRLAIPYLNQNTDRSYDIRIRDTATGRQLLVLEGHADVVVGLAFSTKDKRIASADSEGWVRLWDATTGRELQAFQSIARPLFSMAYHPDGRRVALGGEDGSINMWDATTGRKLLAFQGLEARIDCVAFNLDGTRLAAGSAFGGVKIWDTASGHEPFELPKLPATVFGMAFNPDPSQSRLAMSSGDGTVRLWDVKSMKEALSFRTAMTYGIAFSPDGWHLAGAMGGGTIRILSALPSGSDAVFKPALEYRNDGPVYHAVYSPDGTRLASRERGERRNGPDRVRIRDSSDCRILIDVVSIGSEGILVAFSPDGTLFAGIDEHGSINLRDAQHGQVVRTLGRVKGHGLSLAYSPDGRWIAANDEGDKQASVVVIWNAKTCAETHRLPAGASNIHGLAFSHDGRRIAAISVDLFLRVWNAETGKMQWSTRTHVGWAGSLAFSPDGKQIATGGIGESGLKTWDSATGQPSLVLPGHLGAVTGIAYSADGRFLASCGSDRTVRIWDATCGQEIQTLVGHTDWVTAVAFNPDGKSLASSSRDGTLKIWDVTRLSRGIVNDP